MVAIPDIGLSTVIELTPTLETLVPSKTMILSPLSLLRTEFRVTISSIVILFVAIPLIVVT